MPDRAREDSLAFVLVERDEIARGEIRRRPAGPRLREGERDDAARRRPGDEVEKLRDRSAGAALDLGEDGRGNEATDASSVDGEDREGGRGEPAHVRQRATLGPWRRHPYCRAGSSFRSSRGCRASALSTRSGPRS